MSAPWAGFRCSPSGITPPSDRTHRPSWLLGARTVHKQGLLDSEALRAPEDRAALQAIELQRDAGIEVFTDGEMRRATWMAGFFEPTGGVVPVGKPRVPWHRDGGDSPVGDTDFDSVAVTGKVSRGGSRTSTEASFLAEHAAGQFKITMISSSMGGMLWHPGLRVPPR